MLGYQHLQLVQTLIVCVAGPLHLYAFAAWTGTTLAFIYDTLSSLVGDFRNQVCNISR